MKYQPNPKLDLVLERTVDAPKELLWRGWTESALMKKWFTPAPWKTIEAELDVRPGGKFRTVMQSPDGEKFPSTGCYLETVKNEKLVWTSTLQDGYRPNVMGEEEIAMTVVLTFETAGKGTKYTAVVMHDDEETRQRHKEMGFEQGWGSALDQLVALTKTL